MKAAWQRTLDAGMFAKDETNPDSMIRSRIRTFLGNPQPDPSLQIRIFQAKKSV
jgi:hypothetical protein